jgi:uncharacterized protein (TIGR03083 family)
MEIPAHIAAISTDGARLAQAAATAGLDAPVPWCPGWSVRDLLAHIAGIHRWARSYLVSGRDRETTADEEARFFPAVSDADLLGWYREGHAALVAALREADPRLQCWAFLAAPSPLAFWARRQAHETAIHRADAEQTAGWAPEFSAEFATDGVDELLTGFLARRKGRLVSDPPVSLGVTLIDSGRSWTVRVEPDHRVVVDGVDGVDCELRGAAAAMYLFLWNRLSIDAAEIEVCGDRRVLELWREKARVI